MLEVSEVTIKRVRQSGSLLGFCSLTINGSLRLNNLAIHSRPEGGIRIVYPKSSRQSVQNVFPLNKRTGSCIEAAIYKQCVNDEVFKNDRYGQATPR